MSRRASRPAGPVTPDTDHLVGTWTRADDAAAPEPPERVSGTTHRTGGPTRVHRRVTTAPVPGSDPAPAPEPPRHDRGENDARLLGDRPPHWG